jgi:hypothetical protein
MSMMLAARLQLHHRHLLAKEVTTIACSFPMHS